MIILYVNLILLVCYYFGRDVYKYLQGKVPIGLIESNWGGTRVEAWMSPQARAVCNDTIVVNNKLNDPNNASHLWNGMIVPLLKYNIKGALWYQGEANAGRPERVSFLFTNVNHSLVQVLIPRNDQRLEKTIQFWRIPFLLCCTFYEQISLI
jgi:hypothetical protein